MSNVQIALSIEEYNAMVGKIEELTKEVEFYEDTVNVLLEDIEDYKKELKSYMKQYSCKDEKALKKLFSEQYGADVEDTIKEDILFNNVRDYIVKNVKESQNRMEVMYE